MAVTITQQPTSPNAAYTKLVYVVSGSGTTSNPQYSYVLDIYEDGSSDRISRLFTQPNPAGVGVFDISKIIQGQLEYDNDWKTPGLTVADTSFKKFDIAVSESYGTSISSSVTVYAGGSSGTIEVFKGTVDVNQGSYNFQDSGSFQLLTNQTEGYISNGNYVTLPFLCPPFAEVGTKKVYVKMIYPNPSVTFEGSFPYTFTGADYEIQQLAVGSGSLMQSGLELEDGSWISMRFWVSGSDYDNDPPLTTFYQVPVCDGEQVTFTFINKLGYYDYYTVPNPVQRTSQVEKYNVSLPKVDYSSDSSIYSYSTGGEKDYHTDRTDSFTVTTDYLNQTTANWIEELLESPEVFIQQNGEFKPIVITNSTYRSNTNENRQKLFQYTIEFKPAKGREVYTSLEQLPSIPDNKGFQTSSFDPTLGGTATVLHWYDFTNQNDMTVIGGEVTTVRDKGSSTSLVNLQKDGSSDGPTFIDYRSGSYFSGSTLMVNASTLGSDFTKENGITYVSIFEQVSLESGKSTAVWQLDGIQTWLDDEFYPLYIWNAIAEDIPFAGGSTINYNTNNSVPSSSLPQAFIWDKGNITVPSDEVVASGYAGVDFNQEHMFASTFFTTGSLSGGTYIASFSSSLDGLPSGGETWFRNLAGPGSYGMRVGYQKFAASSATYYDGYIRHLLVYSGSLTDTQISNLYNEWTGSYS